LLDFLGEIRYISATLPNPLLATRSHTTAELNKRRFTFPSRLDLCRDIFIHQTLNGMKTNKSFTKRIKVTKNGKLVARKPGQNHFNARQTGQQRLRRKRTQLLNFSKRISRRFLPGMGAKPLAETNGTTK
jgi:ribosomal protein L35